MKREYATPFDRAIACLAEAHADWRQVEFPESSIPGVLKYLVLGAEAAERRCQALEKDAERYRWLREQCGYVEDGSNETVGIFQDDATKCWHVRVGSKHYGEDNRSLDSVIDATLGKPE
jgi:hypothetical protein